MILFLDGFDHYATADFPMKWTSVLTNTIPPAVVSGAGRRGSGAARFANGNQVNITKALGVSYSTLVLGFALDVTSAAPASNAAIAWFIDNVTTQLSLVVTSDLRLAVYRGASGGTLLGQTAAGALTLATFSYIEIKATFHGSSGSVEVRQNGTAVLTLSGVNTITTANASASGFAIGCDANLANSPTFTVDDLFVLDTTGSSNNTFLGDARIDTLYPNADGTYSQFAPSTGTTHYTLVNEGVPDTTSYVASATVGQKDSCALTDLTLTASVAAIQVSNALSKDAAPARSAANLVRSGTTDYTGTSTALSTTPAYVTSILETDPATGAAWSQSAVNALQVGTTVTA